MVNKLSIKILGIVFVILLIIVAWQFINSGKSERSFRSTLVSIDTAKVTSISLYPKATGHKEVRISKEGNYWNVNIAGGKTAPVPYSKVQSLLAQLISIKPESVAGQNESQWKEFEVDTSGIRVKVYEGNDEALDITIGKFTYQQPRSMSTYVRVSNDPDVYQVNGFLTYVFNHGPDYFRDDHVVNDDYINWNKLTFVYPADSSFQLTKNKNQWEVNGKPADSAKVVDYLSTLSHIEDPNFLDNPDLSLFRKALYTLTIQSSSKGAITVAAYSGGTDMAVTSSQFNDTYFDGKKADFWKRVFVSRKQFFKSK